jgi:hypothetical protein
LLLAEHNRNSGAFNMKAPLLVYSAIHSFEKFFRLGASSQAQSLRPACCELVFIRRLGDFAGRDAPVCLAAAGTRASIQLGVGGRLDDLEHFDRRIVNT